MPEKTFCFLRHAEPLSEEGALTTRGKDQAFSLDLPSFEETFSSPALRCLETASLINKGAPIQVIPELYYQVFELSPSVIEKIVTKIIGSTATIILVVSHAGVSNKVAAALFPQHTSHLHRSLKHAEGFLCREDSCLFVTPY